MRKDREDKARELRAPRAWFWQGMSAREACFLISTVAGCRCGL